MRELSLIDRIYRWNAQFLEKPALTVVASQPLLRGVFSVTGPIGGMPPKGTLTAEEPDGSLWLTPPDLPPDAPYLIYIHGGGFTIGSPKTHRAMAAHIAHAAGMRAYLPRYPLAPEHPFPAGTDTLFQRYKQLCERHDAPAALGGDSAGGNLALVTAIRARDAGLPLPAAMGLIAPVADMTGDLEARFAEAEYLIPPAWPRRSKHAYLADADPGHPFASPLLSDLSGLPPTLLQAAEGEALMPDSVRLAEALPEARLDLWPGLQHVWHLKAGTGAAATRACREMGLFFRDTVATG